MLRLLTKIPDHPHVAVSGGPDSMAALDFLSRGRPVTALFFNHGTEFSSIGESFVQRFCTERKIPLHVGHLSGGRNPDLSLEEFWRLERRAFFSRFPNTITGHHLDDAVETWLMTSLRGKPELIPPQSGTVSHPFLLNRKRALVDWCQRKGVPFLEDPSNSDVRFDRNRVRIKLIPVALGVNPGLFTTVRNLYLKGSFHAQNSVP